MKSIFKFFFDLFEIDLTEDDIEIHEEEMNDELGYYIPNENNIIHINNNLNGINKELTIVHELAHLFQYKYNKSISLDFTPTSTAIAYDVVDANIEYRNKRLEIDARLVELYYIYNQCGREGVKMCISYLIDNTSISNIKRSVLNLKQKDFSTLLLSLLNN